MLHTDEQLMLSVKDGNRDAFQVLTERHYAKHFKFYLSICQEPNTCGGPLSRNVSTVVALCANVPTHC